MILHQIDASLRGVIRVRWRNEFPLAAAGMPQTLTAAVGLQNKLRWRRLIAGNAPAAFVDLYHRGQIITAAMITTKQVATPAANDHDASKRA